MNWCRLLALTLISAWMLVGCRGTQTLSHGPTTLPLDTSTPPARTPTPTEADPVAPATPTAIARATSRPAPTPTASSAPVATPTPTATVTLLPAATITSSNTRATRVIAPAEPVNLPPGFGISSFVEGLKGPRMMALDPDRVLYVAERGRNRIIRLPDRDTDGVADGIQVVATGLDAPSSIAFDRDGAMYVGETTRILRLTAPDANGVFQDTQIVVDGLPPRAGHSTRTVLLSPDGHSLYVSIGSSCNVCIEQDPKRASILCYDPDGSSETIFATGLRNAVGLTFRPGTDELWATNNGRDWLGDDQPPETIYVVRERDDAGWPRCHSGRIIDPDYGRPDACKGVIKPAIEMQAHSAPLGLTFYTGQQFPSGMRGDLFVAFHGSWNRSEPTGYKVVRISMADGTPGPVQDFATGWLREDGSQWGRPVDVLTGADGSLFVSDDGGGHIYRIFYAGG